MEIEEILNESIDEEIKRIIFKYAELTEENLYLRNEIKRLLKENQLLNNHYIVLTDSDFKNYNFDFLEEKSNEKRI